MRDRKIFTLDRLPAVVRDRKVALDRLQAVTRDGQVALDRLQTAMRDRNVVTRGRLQMAGVATAFAFVVGLTAPAAGIVEPSATAGDPRSATAAEATAATDPGTAVDAAATAPAQVADAVVGAVAPAPAAPSDAELYPVGITGAQQRFTPSDEQFANAKAIVDAGKAMNLPPRAWTIAVATSLQESNLHNLGHLGQRNDHDSLGLFQQRPSTGWGTPEQVTDPTYSSKAFYRGLVQVDGWQSMPLTRAAQKVQVSAYPNHYAKHEAQAGDIVKALHGSGPYADLAADVR